MSTTTTALDNFQASKVQLQLIMHDRKYLHPLAITQIAAAGSKQSLTASLNPTHDTHIGFLLITFLVSKHMQKSSNSQELSELLMKLQSVRPLQS